MNLLNDISMIGGPGAVNTQRIADKAAPKAAFGAQQTSKRELLAFISHMLEEKDGAQKAAETHDLSAKISRLLDAKKENNDGLQKTAAEGGTLAKIAHLLKTNPSDKAGLEQLVAELAPDAPAELTTKIAEALQGFNTQAKPGLISDLSCNIVQNIQQAPSPELQVAEVLGGDLSMEQLAQTLNNMQPGTGQGLQTLDPEVMTELMAAFDAFKQAGGEINTEALAQFKTDVTALLQSKGFDTQTVAHYLNSFAKNLREITARPVTVSDVMQQSTQRSWIQETDMSAAAQKAEASTTPPAAPKAPPAGTQNTQPPPPAPQTQQPQTTGQAKAAPAASNLALINGMASGNNSSFSGEFGQQGSFTQNNAGEGAGIIRHSGEAGPQGFINYMAAAKGTSSAMTQMVSLQIQRNAAARTDTFTLQLDPTDLGRLDVRLKFDRDGGVKAHLTAEKPETLAMLQRDAGQLEKLLQQSGLDVDSSGLSFDLREQGGQGFDREAKGSDGADDDFAAHLNGNAQEKTLAAKIAVEAYGYITQSSVNIMV